jgi:hypothetical protein
MDLRGFSIRQKSRTVSTFHVEAADLQRPPVCVCPLCNLRNKLSDTLKNFCLICAARLAPGLSSIIWVTIHDRT